MLSRLIFTALVMLTLVYSTAWHMLATMPESSLNLDPAALWQTSGVDGDARYYLLQADGFERSIAPYRYRVLPTLLVRVIHAATGRDFVWCYLLLNALCMVVTGVAFTEYLQRFYPFGYSTALLGGVLAVTSVGIQSMMLPPMAEPASYVAALAVIWAIHSGNARAFVVASVAAVLTKEVLIVSIPIWLACEVRRGRLSRAGLRAGTLSDGRTTA